MPYGPRLELATFDTVDSSFRRGILGALVEVLAMANAAHLQLHPETPKLYGSRVRYVFNRDRWSDIPTALKYGEGDCKDFTGWRLAELRREGIQVSPHVTVRTEMTPKGLVTIYHVLVEYPDGRLEDPSRMLGMQ